MEIWGYEKKISADFANIRVKKHAHTLAQITNKTLEKMDRQDRQDIFQEFAPQATILPRNRFTSYSVYLSFRGEIDQHYNSTILVSDWQYYS